MQNTGRVLSTIKNIYFVDSDKVEYECRIKGKILNISSDEKKSCIQENPPVCVGDLVNFTIIDENRKQGMITERIERSTVIQRLKQKGRVRQSIIANVEKILIMMSVCQPSLDLLFLDKCLIMADKNRIEPVIIINKIDLPHDKKKLSDYISKYRKLNYKVLKTSVLKKKKIRLLKNLTRNKICSLHGPSGTGKSSLIKLLIPDMEIKIGDVSDRLRRGRHTTTFSYLYKLPFKGYLADTPGIAEIALDIDNNEFLDNYFRDLFSFKHKCFFKNCRHINEKDCEILKQVKTGNIDNDRYNNYLTIYKMIEKYQPVYKTG